MEGGVKDIEPVCSGEKIDELRLKRARAHMRFPFDCST